MDYRIYTDKECIDVKGVKQVAVEEGWINFWSGDVIKLHIQNGYFRYFELIDPPHKGKK